MNFGQIKKEQNDMRSKMTSAQLDLENDAREALHSYQLRQQTINLINPWGSSVTKEQANAKIKKWNDVAPGILQYAYIA